MQIYCSAALYSLPYYPPFLICKSWVCQLLLFPALPSPLDLPLFPSSSSSHNWQFRKLRICHSSALLPHLILFSSSLQRLNLPTLPHSSLSYWFTLILLPLFTPYWQFNLPALALSHSSFSYWFTLTLLPIFTPYTLYIYRAPWAPLYQYLSLD